MESILWQIPLWKMKVSKDQYDQIKKELSFVFITQNYPKKQSLAREAALYYAEWWRREYNGGIASKVALITSLKLPTEFSDELYELAKTGAKKLNITPIVRQNRLWFRSLLIQGGLPINHIQSNNENFIVYKTFLRGLIRHTKSIAINWNDSSFIENLSCVNYLPESFRNEGIYELSLLIARAIYEEDDELFPYDVTLNEWRELTNDLKESYRAESSHAVPFILNWRILKTDSNLRLSYFIEVAKKISNSYILEKNLGNCYSFSLYIQNQYAATYIRSVNDDFICREKRFLNFDWKGEPAIPLYLKTENNLIIEITAPNSFAPDFEDPQALVETDGYWNFKIGTSNSKKNAILYSQDWELPEKVEAVHLFNNDLNWCEFSEYITLKNTLSGEEIIFDNSSSPFSCEFVGWSIDWVQNANYKILVSEPDIRVYNELMERVNTRNIFYRPYRGSEWKKYQKNLLPIGLLEFKIELPDKKYFKERFYYTGNINCSYENLNQDTGEIKFEWSNGNIFPVADQPGLGIICLENNIWQVNRQKNLTQYPETTKFRFYPKPNDTNSPFLEIAVASPFKGVVLLNSKGEEITNNQVLCRTSLYGYRYIVMGQNVKTRIVHCQNQDVRIYGQLVQGIHSLSHFEDNIREMFLLYDSDPFDNESRVMIKIGEKVIFIKEFNLLSQKNEDGNTILIVDNYVDKNIINYKDQLYGILVGCSSNEIVVEELINNGNGGFFLKEGSTLKKFILFSNKSSDEQVVPRYFDFSSELYLIIQHEHSGLNPQEKNIKEIKETLEISPAFDKNWQVSEEWEKVNKYYNIVVEYSLPFKTLNCFRAIAQSPLLIVKMTYLLWQNQNVKKDDLLIGLSRFENELAVAWHWIKESDWNEAMEWLLKGMHESLINGFLMSIFEKKKSLMNYTLNTETGELLNLLGNDSGKIHEVIPPPSLPRIREIREKLGGNTNLPNNLIFIPNEWRELFPMAMNIELPIYVRALLFSPVESALAMTGKDDSIWEEVNSKVRRTINFYRQLLPAEYAEIMLCMVKRILQKK